MAAVGDLCNYEDYRQNISCFAFVFHLLFARFIWVSMFH